MDTAARLAELVAEFRQRSESKHRAAGLSGWAEIQCVAPRMAWVRDPRGCYGLSYRLRPQFWQIVYVDGQGRRTNGIVIGHTRAAAILFLLHQRKAFP